MSKQSIKVPPNNVQEIGDDAALQIILNEYEYQQKRLETSLNTVNQTLTLYGSTLSFLAPVLVAVMAVSSQDRYILYTGLGITSAAAAIATFFTFIRGYKARMEQTDAERALCRLRNYFIDYYPDTKRYLSGTFSDDWPTPFSKRWQSQSFWGWFVLILATGFFSGSSTGAFLFASRPDLRMGTKLTLAISGGMAISCFCYLWLDRRLKHRERMDMPRFPQKK